MKALYESLAALIADINRDMPGRKKEVTDIVFRWARNNFEEFGITSEISLEEERRGGVEIKSHHVRIATTKAALAIAQKCGLGEEEIKMPWEQDRNIDYRPAYIEMENMPVKRLTLRFVALKRQPTSWYHTDRLDTPEEWVDKLVKK